MMRSLLYKIKLILVISVLPVFSQSYESMPQTYGIYGGINYNVHTADFKSLPGIPNCCPQFNGGDGIGPYIGILFNNEINSILGITARLSYQNNSALLTAKEKEWIYVDDAPYYGEFTHVIDLKIHSFNFALALDVEPVKNLRLNLGGEAAYIFSMNLNQKESISDPADKGSFASGSRIRNEYSGKLTNYNNFQLYLNGGLSYRFPLNSKGSLIVAPELSASLPLTRFYNNVIWNAGRLSAGLAIMYNPVKDIYIEPEIELTALLEFPEPPVLEGQIKASAVINGVEAPNAEVIIEEFLSTKMHPILNYIFFDYNSADLPDRYASLNAQEATGFNPSALHKSSPLETYYNAMNIIGYRLKANPTANLTITGCNSNEGDEAGNIELSLKRAESAKNYFTNVWHIEENRLILKTRNLPEKPSELISEDGKEENRRVELYSDNEEILRPLITNDTIRNLNISAIRLRQDYKASLGVKSWRVKMTLDTLTALDKQGSFAPPGIIDDSLPAERIASVEGNLEAEFYLSDSSGRSYISRDTLRINRKTIRSKKRNFSIDKKVDEYSLILFEFNDPKLYKRHEQPINYIKENIDSLSDVTITGYTDRTGEEAYNQKLSYERALSVAKALGAESKARIFGIGENSLLYDNELPEARFYCRTVVVRIETPIYWKE